MLFYVGLDDLYYAFRFERAFISVNRLRERRSHFRVNRWIMDSGAFTEVTTHGGYRTEPEEYAQHIERFRDCGEMELAVAQDWMCEPHVLAITGHTVEEHQRFSIERYDRLRAATTAPLMPVLQGYKPQEYREHLRAYGHRLAHGARVGVGSVCKRNNHPAVIEHILRGIKTDRPDLRLHGFGLKLTALHRPCIRTLLHSTDSMAWSDGIRNQANDMRLALQEELGETLTPKEAREIYKDRGIKMPNCHDWREADAYRDRIDNPPSTDFQWTLQHGRDDSADHPGLRERRSYRCPHNRTPQHHA